MSAREEVLARLRAARDAGAPATTPGPVVRDYLRKGAHSRGSAGAVGLLAERIEDYRATVTRAPSPLELPDVLARLLADAGSVVVPPGIDRGWLVGCTAAVRVDREPEPVGVGELDGVDAVLTTGAVAVAETGTLVLDATDPAQGRRVLTLVPDHHVCVVDTRDVVGTLPEALVLLDPLHPLTFISGPSATSDIEMDRVEGVHGPRRLDVVLVAGIS